MSTHVGRLLKAGRERAKLSQQALSERAGVSFSTVIRLEAGKITPRATTLFRLAELLGVPLEELRTAVAQDDEDAVGASELARAGT